LEFEESKIALSSVQEKLVKSENEKIEL